MHEAKAYSPIDTIELGSVIFINDLRDSNVFASIFVICGGIIISFNESQL